MINCKKMHHNKTLKSFLLASCTLLSLSAASSVEGKTTTTKQAPPECALTPLPYRATVRHIEGGGIGYNKGYTSVDLFAAYPPAHRWVPFIDGRLHVFNNGRIATNAGLGVRYISSSSFVYGANTYYDYRETSRQKYNQVSFGLEALGKIWDFRVNGYFPVGNKRSEFYNTKFDHFSGHLAYLKTTKEFAMKGFNAEAGIHSKESSACKIYAGLGPYYFNQAAQNAAGAKFRLALTFLDWLEIEGSTSYDSVFHWIGQGELKVSIPFGPQKDTTKTQKSQKKSKWFWSKKQRIQKEHTCDLNHLLRVRALQSVAKQEIIVLDHRHFYPVVSDSLTGAPLTFFFVDNTSHSQGTFESPYPTLAEAEAASSAGNVIYVFPGDHTPYGPIVLKNNQKLISSSSDLLLGTTFGDILIPASSAELPILMNPQGNAVRLADNNLVSGFEIRTPLANTHGILGLRIRDLQVDNCKFINTSRGSTSGLTLVHPTGNVTVTNSSFSNFGPLDAKMFRYGNSIFVGLGPHMTLDNLTVSHCNFNNIQQQSSGLYIANFVGWGHLSHLTVSHNSFTNLTHQANGIRTFCNMTSCRITDNTFSNMKRLCNGLLNEGNIPRLEFFRNTFEKLVKSNGLENRNTITHLALENNTFNQLHKTSFSLCNKATLTSFKQGVDASETLSRSSGVVKLPQEKIPHENNSSKFSYADWRAKIDTLRATDTAFSTQLPTEGPHK